MAQDKGKKKNTKNKQNQELDRVKIASVKTIGDQAAKDAPQKISAKEFDKQMEAGICKI